MRRTLLAVPAVLLAVPAAGQPKTAPKTLSAAERAELTDGVAALKAVVAAAEVGVGPALAGHLPDVQVFVKAVEWELAGPKPFDPKLLPTARALLREGTDRAAALRDGKAPWLDAAGVVVRGIRARLDDSVHPYVVTVPAGWSRADRTSRPLYVGLPHAGMVTELTFLDFALKARPEFADAESFQLRGYARGYNAAKFAGEVGVFEQIDHVRANYPTDDRRTAVHGFSMGGSCTWHLAAHHPDRWTAASPGAGFADTEHFVRVWEWEKPPPPWQATLFRWYNATDVAGNLANVPTFAYVGEDDGHKFSHDAMARAAARDGVFLRRAVGPDTGHRYHPASQAEIAAWTRERVAEGLPAARPRVRFSTYTLRYDRCGWVRLDRLDRHWDRADVTAEVEPGNVVRVGTANVAALALDLTPPLCPVDPGQPVRLVVDGYALAPRNAGPVSLVKQLPAAGRKSFTWAACDPPAGPHKVHGLTGPVDDAFLDRFLFVRPTGEPFHPAVGAWAEAERAAAKQTWRTIYRGEVREKADRDITEADIAESNLVLWGDPSGNAVLAKVLPRLPMTWTAATVTLAGRTFPAGSHAPILVYPNPLNPKRYVVVNSGPTQRPAHTKTSALTTPKLPDYAVIDLTAPPDDAAPGRVAAAGFFDEDWTLPETRTP